MAVFTIVRRVTALLLVFAMPAPAFAQETDLTIVATSIREKGYSCDRAERMRPDPEATVSDERTVWIVDCDNGDRRYRLTYLGDTGIEVEPIE
jgi:hypothetical protein